MRNPCGITADPLRNRCGTSADPLRNLCGTSAEPLRNLCGTAAPPTNSVRATVLSGGETPHSESPHNSPSHSRIPRQKTFCRFTLILRSNGRAQQSLPLTKSTQEGLLSVHFDPQEQRPRARNAFDLFSAALVERLCNQNPETKFPATPHHKARKIEMLQPKNWSIQKTTISSSPFKNPENFGVKTYFMARAFDADTPTK